MTYETKQTRNEPRDPRKGRSGQCQYFISFRGGTVNKLYTMYVGLDVPHGMFESDKQVAIESIKDAITQEFGGYSCEQVIGGYRYNDGRTVEEPSLRFEIVVPFDKFDKVRPMAEFAKAALQQESVLLSSQTIDAEFV